jgi:hypothetical protein
MLRRAEHKEWNRECEGCTGTVEEKISAKFPSFSFFLLFTTFNMEGRCRKRWRRKHVH